MHCSARHPASHRINPQRAAILLLVPALVCLEAGTIPAQQPGTAQQPGQAQQPGSASASQEIAAEQFQQWVTQLDDDRFDLRQRAQQQLEQAGQLTLDAVTAAAQTGTLESSTRAINILLKWSEAPQQDLRLAALEKLANLPNRPRESAMATRLLANAREQAALEALTKLGARYTRDTLNHGIGSDLQVIIGPQWKGDYKGLQHLSDVPRAVTISLHSAPLSDAALDHLALLPALQRVEIYGTKISVAAIEKFKRKAPKVTVDARSGALLGVRADPQGNIIQVEPNSAAEKAGIVRGDRITEFNGEKIDDFPALTARIGTHQPGEAATLTIMRNHKTRRVKVTFDQWGAKEITMGLPFNQLRIQAPQILPPKIQVERR